MGRKLIINANNEITYNTLESAARDFRETIRRILDELRNNFDEEDVDSDPGVQQNKFYEELSERFKSFTKLS